MALYYYKALSKTGKKVTGTMDASSEVVVRSDLLAKSLYPIEIGLKKESSSEGTSFTLFQGSVAFKDLMFFTKQLAILLRSGVPLVDSFDLLVEQFKGKLKSIIISLRDGLKEGRSLGDGLAEYPKTFSKVYIQLVRAGEATGKLETILERLTEYLERDEVIRKKMKSAMTGPLIQLGFVFVIVIGMMTTIVPKLMTVLSSFGKEVPWATKLLTRGSDILINHYMALMIVLVAILGLFEYWRSTKSGKKTLDTIKLRTPLIKHFAQTGAVVQFTNTLGMLLESGVFLADALDLVCQIIDNTILVEKLTEAREKIVKQGKITEFLKETGIFPPMATYLINTGEQSGNLDSMLLTVAKNYEEELSELTDSLTAVVNPLMMLVLGGVVGFIMFAIMGPILSSYDGMGAM